MVQMNYILPNDFQKKYNIFLLSILAADCYF